MDFSAFSAAAGGLKTAGDIIKTMLSLQVSVEVRDRVIELQTAIMNAQSGVLSAQEDNMTLLSKIAELEKITSSVEKWKKEVSRFELKKFPSGQFVYALKSNLIDEEPPHYICPNCYQSEIKSILQIFSRYHGGETYRCPKCDNRLNLVPHGKAPAINRNSGW